ncbi:class I adenylate-forming enzyme family protein [Mycolicibacterium sp. 050158]|uniref:class I adenylate-forming enzyme family protein n=1 Tax=Mycolicibacterium sp. 050158 TaxID=3090602 RepID=UPI00299D4D89|nr:class I adenylate-forming enzyme family protein [Mycolicibacterium sp. 050158]MDX1893021.1 class I adenylate-forming enzyme family protein [Mycolicibacterium sp. 050158]
MPRPVWGTEVREGVYRGHPGLVYEQGPSTFEDLLAGTTTWTDRTFLVHGDRRISFAHFRIAARATQAQLRGLGIRPGDRVLVFGYNSPEWVLALWGLWLAGAVPVLANRWWSRAEIDHAIAILAPRHVLTDTDLAIDVPCAPLGDLREAFDATDDATEDGAFASDHVSDADDAALILFTSGSSGMPKAVELSRRSVICNQHDIVQRAGRLPHLLDANSTQVVSLATTPMFHVGGLSSLLTHFLTGGKIVIAEGRFDAGRILAMIEREGIQVWGAVPAMAIRVLEHPDFESFDLSSLKSWPLGGAPVTPALLDRIRAKLPRLRERGLSNTWGMTEAGGFLTVADARDLSRHPGTVGRPYPVVEIRIADPDDDGVGEVLARSPTVMNGYVGVAQAVNAETVDADGWLHSGDLGHLTEDGYLYIDGRSKDVVIRGGENIACPHVEAAIATHPAVVEVAAIGLPHPDLGEELAAVVVHQADAPPPTADELTAHVTGVLSYFAIPTRWQIRADPLPTLAGEKVDKKSLATAFDMGD